MDVKILVSSTYSDWEGSGTNRKVRFHKAGEIVNFPDTYAQDLIQNKMVEPATTKTLQLSVEVEETIPLLNPDATPGALELAAEHGLDLTTVLGTGTDGRITVLDVRRAM